jgi:hypothetical protein
LEHDASTSFKPGPAEWWPVFAGSTRNNQLHPGSFQARFPGSDTIEDFEAVVVRHGTERFVHPRWGADPIPAADAALTDFELPLKEIKAARARWARLGANGRITDELVAPTLSEEGHRRSRIVSVLPTVAGRTVLGMLSRLVHSVSPEEGADEVPKDKLDVSGWLVSDSAANLVAHVSERIVGGNSGKFGKSSLDWGWRLGAELDRTSAIVAIRGIDDWLSTLWEDVDSHLGDLERTWVLPRPPWVVPRGLLLQHSRVARNWGSWTLRYIKSVSRAAIPRSLKPSATIAVDQRILHRIKEAAPTLCLDERTFAVIDLCDLRLRLAVIKESATAQVWRLARELSAQAIVLKDIAVVIKVRKVK